MTPAKLVYGGVSGAGGGTSTLTPNRRRSLNPLRLAVPPRPHIVLVAPAGIEPRIPDLRGRFP
jgi:hypothetical protein